MPWQVSQPYTSFALGTKVLVLPLVLVLLGVMP